MWILFITWDDFDFPHRHTVGYMSTNTTHICKNEEDAKRQYEDAMSSHWNDVAYAQYCFFPELA